MDNYLMRYKGQYRLMSAIDLATNDFPRNESGNIDTDDVYIACKNGCQIYHYGSDILVAYIPSKRRGLNVLKQIEVGSLGDHVIDVKQTDQEVLFRFKAKFLDEFAPLLNPLATALDRSPFSVKNLPKSGYRIPEEDLLKYKEAISGTDSSSIGVIRTLTYDFLTKTFGRSFDYKAEMKKLMMKPKEYIHYKGKWDAFVQYLLGNI